MLARALGALIPVLAVGLAALNASPGGEARGDGPVPVLVELFTSEGCSSCPPADALLIELAGTQPVDGVHVIALGEHVDYWNRLGWVDRFSSAEFTRRQEAYAHAARTNQIYTPQAIVDGHLALVGSDRASVFAAVRRAASAPKPGFDLAWIPSGDDGVRLVVSLPDVLTAADADVYLVVVEDGLVSMVTRGENAGRELPHIAVARRLTRIGRTTKAGGFRESVAVDPGAAANPETVRVIVFAQRGAGRVLALGMTSR